MASNNAYSQLTMLEMAKRETPRGAQAKIAEVLDKTHEVYQDAPWLEANDTWSNKTTRRGNLPTGSWKDVNGGVASEASQTIEVWDSLGKLAAYMEVDCDIIDKSPQPRQARNDEEVSFLEGMSQTWVTTMIYGNALVDTEQFTGLAARLNSLSSSNVLGCGGTGADLSSIYIVQWGPTQVYMAYPRNSKNMGITRKFLGEVTKERSDGTLQQVYRTYFSIEGGMVVRNERNIARLCNIETSGSTNILDTDKLIQLLNKMPRRGAGAVLYCNSTIFSQFDIEAKDKTNVQYGPKDVWGRETTFFRGHPVRLVEEILDTESAVS